MKAEILDDTLKIEIDLRDLGLRSATGVVFHQVDPDEPVNVPEGYFHAVVVAIAGIPG